jgi:hypothetical protein
MGAVAILALAVALAGCGKDNPEAPAPQPTTPSIAAVDQTIGDLATQVTVASAASDGPGWAVIRADDGGAPGAVIGQAHLAGGASAGVVVALSRPSVDGETLHAALHIDAGAAGAFEYPGVDAPVAGVAAQFEVTVPEGTPAVRLRVSNVGMTSYTVTRVEPERFSDMVGGEVGNPSLTLPAAWRYEIVNAAHGAHPFELIDMGASPPADVVLLGESVAGTMESDASVAWSDDGQGRMRFTLSPSLAAVLSGYRCTLHPTTMRGPIALR